jgi:fatty acid desaturase
MPWPPLNVSCAALQRQLPCDFVEVPSLYRVAPDHERRTYRMLAETFGTTLALALLAAGAHAAGQTLLVWLLAIPRGMWILRHYAVGHEASHAKLFPGRPMVNAIWGQLALLALLTPLPVFRKVHQFHHGYNRRDEHTSALEVHHVGKNSFTLRTYAWVRWLFLVFAAGWFWHGLVSILLFLALPVTIATRISPAFKGWSSSDRLWSIATFALAIAGHVACGVLLGADFWIALCGLPLLVFAWVYSLQLYVYHYDTPIGDPVTANTRCLGGPAVGFWLLNLNEHATHHQRPAIVWYLLPEATKSGVYVEEQRRRSWLWGITNQLRGPRIVVAQPTRAGGSVER